MSTKQSSRMTLADVLVRISGADLPPKVKADTSSAVRKIATILGADPALIPVDPANLRRRLGIAFEGFLNLKRLTLNPASHVGMLRRNPDQDAGRDGNHACAIAWRTRISAGASTSTHKRRPPTR